MFRSSLGLPPNGRWLCRFCGRSVPPSITSTDNQLTLLFVSDASLATEGFSASYTSINASTGTPLTVPTAGMENIYL